MASFVNTETNFTVAPSVWSRGGYETKQNSTPRESLAIIKRPALEQVLKSNWSIKTPK